jgi:DNA repair protein RadC
METLSTSDLIRDLPPSIRPMARLQSVGVEAMKDAELLSLAVRSRSLKPVEEHLTHHSLKELLAMPWSKLATLHGIGEAGAAALLASAELVRRGMNQPDPGRLVLQSVNDVAAQAIEIRDKKKEYLLAFFLNARHQLISKELISIGTLTASLAHPREIFAPAIGQAAAGVILVHNHPSGDPSPSDEDIRLTRRIAQAGQIMGIDLLDHLIVAQSGCHSFKTSGALV